MTDPEPETGPRRRFALSANMPRDWLHRRELWDLDDAAWRVYWSGCQWAIGETDGVIPYSYLGLLHPNLADAIAAAERLLEAGLWAETPEGYLIVDWPRFNHHPATIAHGRWMSRKTSRANRDSAGDMSQDGSRKTRNVKTSTHLESELAGTSGAGSAKLNGLHVRAVR